MDPVVERVRRPDPGEVDSRVGDAADEVTGVGSGFGPADDVSAVLDVPLGPALASSPSPDVVFIER